MVNEYFEHVPSDAFGLIHYSPQSPANALYLSNHVCLAPALEDVLLWDMKTGNKLAEWHVVGFRSPVSCMALSPTSKDVAVGYEDGSIRIWDLQQNQVKVTLDGHRKSITALQFDATAQRLASGSQDTDVVIWDVLLEQGLFKLKGHKNQITTIQFAGPDHLSSASKDTLLKFWHLPTQHCLDTVVAHRSECWSSVLLPLSDAQDESILLTSGSEGEVKLWSLELSATDMLEPGTSKAPKRYIKALKAPQFASPSHAHRIQQVAYDPQSGMIGLQTAERTVEFARILSVDEIKKKQARRRKRRETKQQAGQEAEGEANQDQQINLADRLSSWTVLRSTAGKVKSFALAAPATSREARGKSRSAQSKSEASVLLALSNNALQTYTFPLPSQEKKAVEAIHQYTVGSSGHRADVRALCLSSDDALLASISQGSVKVWNRRTLHCIRTIEDNNGYGLCGAFLPGDRHVIVGTKEGHLELYDIGSSALVYKAEAAHAGPIWSLQVHPSGKQLITGSSDKSVKMWDFVVTAGKEGQPKGISLKHVRTLKMNDDVLSIRISPDARLLAVATLDFTVKVFFFDTLKFFLSLYGHKLPVVSMDISHDSGLIVTSSADKNIKVWGLKFGDCHVSLFAHQDTVMGVQFEADSHYFWSVGKDGIVKYWDGDKFECIQKLEGHHSDVLCLATSQKGRFVITASTDKSIRVWEKTDEPLFIQEQRERELEQLYDAPTGNDQLSLAVSKPGEEDANEAGDVAKTTVATLTAGERIIDALELSDADRQAIMTAETTGQAREPRNPILAFHGDDYTGEKHVLLEIEKIPSSQLSDALLILPFSKVSLLVAHIQYWIQQRWNIPLASRVLFFLLKVHHSQIVATQSMRDQLLSLRADLRTALTQQKDVIGFNLAALKFMQKQQEENRTASVLEKVGLEDERAIKAALEEGVKKRKRAIQ